MPIYTHFGFRPEVGYVHSGRLYGHADYRGVSHACNGTPNTYSGAEYRSLCGKIVVADHDGERFNVVPATDDSGAGVQCKRCKAVIAKEQKRRRVAEACRCGEESFGTATLCPVHGWKSK